MTNKRRRYLFICLTLLACGILLVVGNLPARAAGASLTLPPGLTAIAQPVPMPTFSLFSPKGVPMRSADVQGKIVVIRFWATW